MYLLFTVRWWAHSECTNQTRGGRASRASVHMQGLCDLAWWLDTELNMDIPTVRTCIKFQRSLVKSGGVRCELNLCVGSPVTEAYGKSDDVSESSRSYVGDGQRLCIKHREFFQNDNGKKGQKLIS